MLLRPLRRACGSSLARPRLPLRAFSSGLGKGFDISSMVSPAASPRGGSNALFRWTDARNALLVATASPR